MAPAFFRVEGLTKRFGGLTAVSEVSFELRRDQIVGLIGPNGAGKTTLLRLITKILRPDSGRVVFNGRDITGLRPWEVVERGIAGTFQNTRPFRHLPIIANIMVPLVAPRARTPGLSPWAVAERGTPGPSQTPRPSRHLPIIANIMAPLVAPRARKRRG